MTTKTRLEVQIRWMIRRDMPAVLRIEERCFGESCWVEEDFIALLSKRNCIGMVAVDSVQRIAGFMVYELHKDHLHLQNFAVDPAFQRQGVGTQLIAKLQCKLSQQRRTSLALTIRESNLPGQLFFRAMGFVATGVLREHFEDCDEDAYTMRFQLKH